MGQRSIFGPKEKVSQESYDKIHFFLCFFIFFKLCAGKNKENVDNKSTNNGDDNKIILLKRNMGQAKSCVV